MAHIVHCRICKNKIDTDKETNWVKPTERMYYHKSCYENFAKKKGAIKEGDISVEVEDSVWLEAVYDYLRYDLKMSVNYQKLLSQWNHFLKKTSPSMTAKGIYFSLRYFYEVAHGDTAKSENGIGIVPHIYKEGTEYWGNRNERDKGICDRIEAQIRQSEKTKTKVIYRTREPKQKKGWVSFDDVANMEEQDD